MRIDKPCCIHNDLKMICKYHSDGNCMRSVSRENLPCDRPFLDIREALTDAIYDEAVTVSTTKPPRINISAVGITELRKIMERVFSNGT